MIEYHYGLPPSPLYYAPPDERFYAKIYLKREELNHTGAHKINHCIGEVLLAKRMGKTRIIARRRASTAWPRRRSRRQLKRIYMGELDR